MIEAYPYWLNKPFKRLQVIQDKCLCIVKNINSGRGGLSPDVDKLTHLDTHNKMILLKMNSPIGVQFGDENVPVAFYLRLS